MNKQAMIINQVCVCKRVCECMHGCNRVSDFVCACNVHRYSVGCVNDFVRLSVVHKLVVTQLLYNLSWLLMCSYLYKLASQCLSLAESVHVAAADQHYMFK